jgi:hypothetical protein
MPATVEQGAVHVDADQPNHREDLSAVVSAWEGRKRALVTR